MARPTQPFVILLADDDPDDVFLTCEAMELGGLDVAHVHTVADGGELLSFLRRPGNPRPQLILLDLNMPGVDGFDALRELKADEDLASLPVVILTTSAAEGDVSATYRLGAASYVQKPRTFQDLVDVMRVLERYWRETVRIPAA